ncbi:hypothetical protein ABPG74_016788 [Tetrahymena malaccensis]
MKNIKKVSCFGAGYVGGPTMAVFASKHPQIQFTIYDIDKQQIEKWQQSETLPVFESGLSLLLEETRNKNLSFTCDINQALDDVDIIFLAVNTPIKQSLSKKESYCFDIKYIEACTRSIAEYFDQKKLNKIITLVEKSTVPVLTSKHIYEILQENQNFFQKIIIFNQIISFILKQYFIYRYIQKQNIYGVLFINIRSAINDLLNPERVIIGGGNSPEEQNSTNMLKELYEKWVNKDKIILTNIVSSELSKLVSNSFLAQRVSSINSITALCEATGANIEEVKKCIASDSRIGSKFLNCSVGFGGSCFKKDVLGLAYICESRGLTEVADYWKQVVKMNEYQKQRFSKLIIEKMYNNLDNKIITIFGVSYKKNTNDVRDSASITVAVELLKEGAVLHIYDPLAKFDSMKKEMQRQEIYNDCYDARIKFFEDGESASINSHAIIILTEWEDFKQCKYERMFKKMKRPSFIFDGRNLLNREEIEQIGYAYIKLG